MNFTSRMGTKVLVFAVGAGVAGAGGAVWACATPAKPTMAPAVSIRSRTSVARDRGFDEAAHRST